MTGEERECIWMVKEGPEPLLEPEVLENVAIDHVNSETIHVYAILCPDRHDRSLMVYKLGLLLSHVEDMGVKELSQIFLLLTCLAEDGWDAHIEYVDTWWEKVLIRVYPMDTSHASEEQDPKTLHVLEDLARDPVTRIATRPMPTTLPEIVEGLLDTMYETESNT